MLDEPPWRVRLLSSSSTFVFHHVDCFLEVDSTFPTLVWVRSTHFPYHLWPVHTRLGLAHSDFVFLRKVDLSPLFLVVFDGLSVSFTSWVYVNDLGSCDVQ